MRGVIGAPVGGGMVGKAKLVFVGGGPPGGGKESTFGGNPEGGTAEGTSAVDALLFDTIFSIELGYVLIIYEHWTFL